MILSSIIMGAAILIGTSLLITFWNKVVDFLKRVITKITPIVNGVVYGTRIFLKKMHEAAKEISKNYSKNGTQWEETVVEKTIPLNELPDEYKSKLSINCEQDYTKELEMQLQQQ